MLHGKQQGVKNIGMRGNTLTMLRGDRVEWELGGALPAREIKRMVSTGKGGSSAEQEKRESFEQGVSVEGEFAFTQAIGKFCRISVGDGTFKGNYQFNLKEQMTLRASWGGWKAEKVVRIVMVGGSQMGRIKTELMRVGGEQVDVVGMVRIPGELDEKTVNFALDELAGLDGLVDKIFVGGPTNSLMVHGDGDRRGFFPERKVLVKRNAATGEQEWVSSYHMTEPRKISMAERRGLVDRFAGMIRTIQVSCPEAEINYLTMFPRFAKVCCHDHMTEEDVFMMDGVRRDVDRDIKEMLLDNDEGVGIVEWWDILGFDKDLTVTEIGRLNLIDRDGVHLTARANKCAAVSLCDRIRGRTARLWGSGEWKRRRMEK
jgi:hypothetical protein